MRRDSEYSMTPGSHQVSDSDLVGKVLGLPNGDAEEILDRVGGLRHLATTDLEVLVDMPGVGPASAERLLAAIEIGRRLEAQDMDQKSFVSSTDVARYFMPRMRDLRKEIFMVLMLDARNCLIRGVTVSVGSLTASIVHPREVFKPAILSSAASVILRSQPSKRGPDAQPGRPEDHRPARRRRCDDRHQGPGSYHHRTKVVHQPGRQGADLMVTMCSECGKLKMRTLLRRVRFCARRGAGRTAFMYLCSGCFRKYADREVSVETCVVESRRGGSGHG